VTNIVLYVKNLQGRGVQKVYLNLAKGLQALGATVHFVIGEDRLDLEYGFVEYFYLYIDDTSEQLDTLLATLDDATLITADARMANILKSIPQDRVFYTIHMLWSKRIFRQMRIGRLFELKSLYKNKNILCASNAICSDLRQSIKIKPKSSIVIHDSFDIEQIKYLSLEHLDLDFPYILNIGALSREKNHTLLIKTYAKLHLKEDLVILGEGKMRNSLEKLIKHLGMENRIHLLGWKVNPYPYIKNTSLFISTSKNEGLHGATIESLVLGTPVVSTDSIGIREVLTDELGHYIVTNKSLLGTKIEEALSWYPTIDIEKYYRYDYINIAQKYLAHIHGARHDK